MIYGTPFNRSYPSSPNMPRYGGAPRYNPTASGFDDGSDDTAPVRVTTSRLVSPGAPSFTGNAPSYPSPRVPGAPTADYAATHSPGWLTSLDRQRTQTSTMESTFAAARDAGVDRASAGRQAFVAAHPAPMFNTAPTAAPPADPKATEAYYGGIMKQAISEHAMASRSYDKTGKDAAIKKYSDARDAINGFRQQRLQIGSAPSFPLATGTAGQAGPMLPGQIARPTDRYIAQPLTGPSDYSPDDYSHVSTPGAAPTAPTEEAHPFGDSGGATGANQVTSQQARQMWHTWLLDHAPNLIQANGGLPDGPRSQREYVDHQNAFLDYLGHRYGVDRGKAEGMMRGWADAGTATQNQFPRGQRTITTQAAPQMNFPGAGGGRSGMYTLPSGEQVIVDTNGQRVGPAVGHTAPLAPTFTNVTDYGPERGYSPINGPGIPSAPSPTPPGIAASNQAATAQQGNPDVNNAPEGSVARSKKDGQMYVRQQGAWVKTQ